MTEQPCTMVWGGYDPKNQTPRYSSHESVYMIACIVRHAFESSQNLWYVCDETGDIVYSHHEKNSQIWARDFLEDGRTSDSTNA